MSELNKRIDAGLKRCNELESIHSQDVLWFFINIRDILKSMKNPDVEDYHDSIICKCERCKPTEQKQPELVLLDKEELIKTLENMPCVCHTNYAGDRRIIADFIWYKFGTKPRKEPSLEEIKDVIRDNYVFAYESYVENLAKDILALFKGEN